MCVSVNAPVLVPPAVHDQRHVETWTHNREEWTGAERGIVREDGGRSKLTVYEKTTVKLTDNMASSCTYGVKKFVGQIGRIAARVCTVCSVEFAPCFSC